MGSPEEREEEIRLQLEFYFSDANLRKDRFLRSVLEEEEDTRISAEKLLTFRKLQELNATEKDLLAAAKKSNVLQADENSFRIGRVDGLPPPKPDEVACTIYVERLSLDASVDSVKTLFSQYGNVIHVSLPRRHEGVKKGELYGFAFVEFDKSAQADAAVKGLAPNIESDGAVRCMHKATWDRLKGEYKQLQREYAKGNIKYKLPPIGVKEDDLSVEPIRNSSLNPKQVTKPTVRPDKGNLQWKPNVLVSLSNIGPKVTKTILRNLFKEEEKNIAYVDFKKGSSTAVIRFNGATSATKALSILGREKNCEMKGQLLKGDLETGYWAGLGVSTCGEEGALPSDTKTKEVNEAPPQKKRRTGSLKSKKTHITFDD
eukprot:m.53117 g.53117  ORF g.53117 m.53117 type:complete len:373 (-) comp10842_c0_seq2:950-2068(-)